MNPVDLLTKLVDNPRTSGGAIIAVVGVWLLSTYPSGPEHTVGLIMLALGVIFIGFCASDSSNTVQKSNVDKLPKDKPLTPADLTQKPPEPPIKVEIVDNSDPPGPV